MHAQSIRSGLDNILLMSQALSNAIDVARVAHLDGQQSHGTEEAGVMEPSALIEMKELGHF